MAPDPERRGSMFCPDPHVLAASGDALCCRVSGSAHLVRHSLDLSRGLSRSAGQMWQNWLN